MSTTDEQQNLAFFNNTNTQVLTLRVAGQLLACTLEDGSQSVEPELV